MYHTILVEKPKVVIDARSGLVISYNNEEKELIEEVTNKKK